MIKIGFHNIAKLVVNSALHIKTLDKTWEPNKELDTLIKDISILGGKKCLIIG
ncbi:MAG: hypothetical protein WC614_07720 [bacterium]